MQTKDELLNKARENLTTGMNNLLQASIMNLMVGDIELAKLANDVAQIQLKLTMIIERGDVR